jgi:hypothetical protein
VEAVLNADRNEDRDGQKAITATIGHMAYLNKMSVGGVADNARHVYKTA